MFHRVISKNHETQHFDLSHKLVDQLSSKRPCSSKDQWEQLHMLNQLMMNDLETDFLLK